MNTIRRARPEEAELLTHVLRRSKAHWGYDAATMELFMPLLVITIGEITDQYVYVIEDSNQQIYGFYRVALADPCPKLEDLFIDPAYIGQGFGKQLFLHAAELIHTHGYPEFIFEADPNAESFYLTMGAIRTGERESMIPGRFLPQMKYHYDPTR